MNHLPALSTGEQDFEELRNQEFIYVDKTAFIYDLVFIRKSKFNFLSRPRRFGKSLLISTLKCLFEGKKELFKGLYIYDKISWETYPVIHLDFSKMDFQSVGLRDAIEIRLCQIANQYGFELGGRGNGLKFAELMQSLHQKTGKKVAILIDEYDKPITDVLEVGKNEKAYEHRDMLRELYAVLKGNSAHIQFFFMTGIAKFSRVSLFSDLNNLTDLNKNKHFHNLLGYTEEEIKNNFKAHLNAVAAEQKISLEALLEQMKYWYNGFSWNGRDYVYNPYSILQFLSVGEFKNFWFDSGTPKFLIQNLKKSMHYNVGRTLASELEIEQFNIDNLNIETLFFQTGYYTIKGHDTVGRLILDYPNNEVEQAMTAHILQGFAHTPKSSIALDITIAVQTHDMELLITTVNKLFATIPYQIFDQHREKYFHAVLFLALKLCGFHIEAEVSVSTGRLDAVMQHQNRIYIFEFKLDDNADNALKQIREKEYFKKYAQEKEGKEIYLLGIGFSSKTKEVEEWKMESL